MSVTFPAFPAEFFADSTDATVNALKPIIEATWSGAESAAGGLTVIREAETNAVKALDTSENEAAVKYRGTLARKTAAAEKINGEMQAELDAVRARFADQINTLTSIDKVVTEQRAAALTELAKDATAGIDAQGLSKAYETAVATLKGLVGAVVAVAPDAADKFKLPTVTQVIRGGRSSKDGERQGWRPRYNKITVNGEEVPGAENAKTGKVGNPTFTQAAKLAKVSSGILLSELNDSMGNTFSWDNVNFAEDGSYSFKLGTVNGKDGATVKVWPKLDSNDDSDDTETENVPAEF